MKRRHWLHTLLATSLAGAAEHLPQKRSFLGVDRFQRLVALAIAGNWRAQPMGQRVALFGQAMLGTKYVGWTLEIDDHIESPSVNFLGLDCWTFFETALGLARMIARSKAFVKSRSPGIAAACAMGTTSTAFTTSMSGSPTTPPAAMCATSPRKSVPSCACKVGPMMRCR
jgi:hypothetical protein